MKCKICSNNLEFNLSTGELYCPICSRPKSLEILKKSYNLFNYYKVIKTENLDLPEFITEEKLKELSKDKNIKIKIKYA